MRVLVNASNLRAGGGVQKAVEFIHGAVEWGGRNKWLFMLSPEVKSNLAFHLNGANAHAVTIPVSPARPMAGRRSRRMLTEAEDEFEPDVVFTVSGPAYHIFRAPHLMGYGVPWVTHPSRLAWSKIRGVRANAYFRLWCLYNAAWARYADRWLLQTETAAMGLSRRLRKPRELFAVIPNCCSYVYFAAGARIGAVHAGLEGRRTDEYRLLVFADYCPHKGLEIIPRVAASLRDIDPSRTYVFFLTFDRGSQHWERIEQSARVLCVAGNVVNIGPQPVHVGPALYRSCSALFLPTLLESFTATYPEAMCMRRPIITSDLDFARDICRDAAMYFKPDDAQSAANAVKEVASDQRRTDFLTAAGARRLSDFGDSETRFRRLLDLLEDTAESAAGQVGAP